LSTAENKALMRHIFSELEKGNGRPLTDSLAEDCTWIVMGSTPWSKTYRGRRAIVSELLRPLNAQFATPYTNVASRFVAEDDLVVVECRGQTTTRTGQPYHNRYCWVCRLEGGKLREITEYMDTQLVAELLRAP
jgi:ketosteroid isomerase-like protein